MIKSNNIVIFQQMQRLKKTKKPANGYKMFKGKKGS